MSWDNVQADWQRHIGHVRILWGKLSEDELHQINGRREVLLDKIQQKYRITKTEAEEQVQTFEGRF